MPGKGIFNKNEFQYLLEIAVNKCYTKHILTIVFSLFLFQFIFGQSDLSETYINPIIPGDHPDPTLTKVGNDFYTSGSSFNPTPKIYHSTDLVHWEVISQPVSASWSGYGNSPGGGIWGGHMVFYNGKYWHFFGRGGGSMYFVKADYPEGPWSSPTRMNVPAGIPGLGVDNSIFIDDDNKWYLLTKAGQENNHIVELGANGQPNGNVLDLTWLNPNSEGNPYGWAEGPVMWKHNGYYYYSFAQHLAGSQYVMRSDTLSDNKSDWTIDGSNMFYGTADVFPAPNHISPAVELDDGTSWVIAHSYRNGWYAHGRQGLLCEVVYNLNGFPKIKWPVTSAKYVPELSNKGIPWMVPHSDLFDSGKLNPEWSFLGYTPSNTWSLSENPGWLKLSPIPGKGENTVIKNDGEHNYSLITKVDFDPVSENHEAGLWIINGPETHQAKVISTVNPEGKKIIAFSFENTRYEVENTAGSVVWLKIIRNEHRMTGFFSSNGKFWTQIGEFIDASDIDIEQTQFNNFTGNQQGLYVKGKAAWFDLYIYRDAFTSISAASPANKYHTSVYENNPPPYTLTSIHNSDWTMYAGVEFGNSDYAIEADSVLVSASCATSGGKVRIVLDSLNGAMIAEVQITNTGGLNKFQDFTSKVTGQIFGCHDVYLKYSGFVTTELFRLKSFVFSEIDNATPVNDISGEKTGGIQLLTNYPNPYQTTTEIQYHIPCRSHISLKVYELNGRVIETLYEGIQQPGKYSSTFNSGGLSGVIYICRLVVEKSGKTQNLIIVKQN